VDVTVFCPTRESREPETYRGVTLRFVKFSSLGKYSEMFWDARSFCQARGQYDVVYMLGLGGAFAAWVPRAWGARVWVNTDGVEWKRTKFSWPQRAYLAMAEALSALFAHRIIADSPAIATYLHLRYPGLRNISTIAYGADTPKATPGQGPIEEFGLQRDGYYLVVCRLEPENHLHEIIAGYEQSGSQLPLVIVGNIESPNVYVSELLHHRGARVRFIGTVFDREKLTALRFHCRAYMHGHSVGGTNPSLLEAMACSNLVIAHNNAFNKETLGASGLFFLTSKELASHVEAIDAGAIKIEDMRIGAKERIQSRYQWDHIADEYIELLKGF
jgi:glycosyltransferase involved in cell wall biosynthesis